MPGMGPPGEPSVLVMPHVVRSGETDARGRLSLVAVCELLQESAGRHAVALGVGADVLSPRGLAWVLVEWRVAMERYPVWRDELTVETWPSDLSERFATRDFRLVSPDRGEIGRATSHWAILDVARRRPVRMPDLVRAIPRTVRGRALPGGLSRLAAPDPAETVLEVAVRWTDLDRNGHVNNLSYVAWTVESVPREILHEATPRELAISFRSECRGDAAIAVQCAREAAGSVGGREVFRHRIVERETGRELSLARTAWTRP